MYEIKYKSKINFCLCKFSFFSVLILSVYILINETSVIDEMMKIKTYLRKEINIIKLIRTCLYTVFMLGCIFRLI